MCQVICFCSVCCKNCFSFLIYDTLYCQEYRCLSLNPFTAFLQEQHRTTDDSNIRSQEKHRLRKGECRKNIQIHVKLVLHLIENNICKYYQEYIQISEKLKEKKDRKCLSKFPDALEQLHCAQDRYYTFLFDDEHDHLPKDIKAGPNKCLVELRSGYSI